jgi:D-alanine-D-alanine ligase
MRDGVVIVHDAAAAAGRPDSSDTLVEAAAIGGVLGDLGFAVSVVPVGLDLAALERRLGELEPRVVFNLVESLEGRGQLLHLVPALLGSLQVPFTGCSSAALAATSHKVLAKRALARAGLPVPATFDPLLGGAGPWIVKSLWEHASLGIDDASIVDEPADVVRLLEARRAELGGEWFAERYVPGRELNVALLATADGPRVLSIAEMRFQDYPPDKPRIVSYVAKWDAASFEYRNTVRSFAVEPELAERARRIALDCWELFALDGYARVDLRVDAAGVPWVLEINANPCLAPDAGFAAAAAATGIDFQAVVAAVIDDALHRSPRARQEPIR